MSSALVLVVVAALVVTIGVVTCVVSGRGMGGRPGGPAEPAAAPMLALHQGMDRLSHELSAQRDRQVRLQSVETDIALDLPPSIQLPDGEELPYGSGNRLHIRDPEQESEIYQKCVRPPPNRTVLYGESPPPYRSSSAGLLASDWSSGSSSGSGGLLRCHSMSASQPVKRPPDNILGRTVRCFSGRRHEEPPPPRPPPTVIVPTPRCRRIPGYPPPAAAESASTLASLPTVHCTTDPAAAKPQRPPV